MVELRAGLLFGGIVMVGLGFFLFGLGMNYIHQVNYCLQYSYSCGPLTAAGLDVQLMLSRGFEIFAGIIAAIGVVFVRYGFTSEKRKVWQATPYSTPYQTSGGYGNYQAAQSQVLQMQQYCGYCGKKVVPGASYCHNCGQRTF